MVDLVEALRQSVGPYYLRPDGKVGHDAFAVIPRNHPRDGEGRHRAGGADEPRAHIIALEPMDKGLVGTPLRYPYEVRSEQEHFDEIQDVKVTKDMLDLTKHTLNQKAGRFDPEKFEDHWESALVELINQKRAGKVIQPKERPKCGNAAERRSGGRTGEGDPVEIVEQHTLLPYYGSFLVPGFSFARDFSGNR